MTIKTITSAALIATALLINPASSAEPNWRLVVVFVEESVGAINRLPRTYKMAWIERGGVEKTHRKAFRAVEKAKVEGTKHRTWTRDVTTNSTKWVAIYDYAKMRGMWKGPPKKFNALSLLRGKSIANLQKQIEKKAAENKYLGYRAVVVINMQAAKLFLNSQAQNPFFGDLPANVTATN